MNVIARLFFAVIAAIGIFVVPVQAAILYVDNKTPCPGNGSTATPYCAIQSAFNVANPGDHVKIRTGTGVYDGQTVISRSGTVSAPIVIEPDTGANFIVRWTGNGVNDAAMVVRKASHVTVQNLTFDGTGVWTSWIGLFVQATTSLTDGANMTGIRILNNNFRNWGGTAAQASNSGARTALAISGGFCPGGCTWKVLGALVSGNTFDAVRGRTVQILHADNTIFEKNIIENPKCAKDSDNAINTIGIHILDSGNYFSNGTVIRDNVFRNWENRDTCGIANHPGAFDSSIAIWCDVGPSNGIVERNIISNIHPGDTSVTTHASTGIHIELGCFNWIVRNNVVYDIGWHGLSQRIYSSGNPADWTEPATQFLNNTVFRVSGRVVGLGAGKAIIKNNIISAVGARSLMSPSFNTASAYDIDYNLYFDTNTSNNTGEWGADFGGPITNLATWRSNCNCDRNSIFANPMFISTTSPFNFALQSGSPAIDSGTTLPSITTDFSGLSRPQGIAYDRGAYEFNSGGGAPLPTPPPPSSGATFPTTPILSTFTGANQNPLSDSGNWTTVPTENPLQRIDNQVSGTMSYSNAYWGASTFGPTTEVYTTLSAVGLNGQIFYLGGRLLDQASDGYYLVVHKLSGTDTWQMLRYENGISINIGAAIIQEVSAGDSMGLSISGSTLTAWYKAAAGSWLPLFTRTDSTFGLAGNISIGMEGSTWRADNFGGGSVSAGGPVAPVNLIVKQ